MFDAHCHLDFAQFDEDRQAILTHAAEQGVRGLLIAGYDSERRALAAELAKTPGVFAAAGLHPWAVRDLCEDEERLEREMLALEHALSNSTSGAFCALGECGLDYFVIDASDTAARSFQERAFLMQLDIARAQNLPVIIHAVRCHDRLARLLTEHPHPPGGQLHGYSGPVGMVSRFIELGWALSFGTPLTWDGYQKNKKALCRAWECAPQMVTLETDAPDRPVKSVGRAGRGEPSHMRAVVDAASVELGVDADELAARCEENARRIFGLPEGENLGA